MNIISEIHNKYQIVSIVGMGKNAGKTVTLNSVIEEAMEEGITLGLTSTGRDGESEDIVTNTEKPMIYVPEGTLVATATENLQLGDAKIEILNVTKYHTPMGPVVIGRVKDSGYVQIAGPQTNKEIKAVSEDMLNLGAGLVIIDGAIDRVSSAAPAISQGTILATGAVISRDMNKVIEETLHTVELFRLPEISDQRSRSIIEEVLANDSTAIISKDYDIKYLDIKTALNSGGIIASNMDDDSLYVVLPGALVKKTLEDIIKANSLYKNIRFVVKDGTKIFIDPRSWQIFMKQGIKVEVLDSIKTLAVTLNPYAPQGYYFDPKEFLSKMTKYLKDVPVYDVILGGE